MRIAREDLLSQLEALRPGLARSDDEVEQGSCFIFDQGNVFTFNDEISCLHECSLGFTGAIVAEPFLAMLRAMPESDVELKKVKGGLLLKSKRRETIFKMEREINIPIETLEKPKKSMWKPMSEQFADAVEAVQHCAGKNKEGQFFLTCIHIHPKWVEAFDNYHLARFRIRTGIKEPILIRRDSIKHLTQLGMSEFAETETWIHFRNLNGLMMSCRRYTDTYPDLKSHLKHIEGVPSSLPKGLIEAARRADIAASEKSEENDVTVFLSPRKMKIIGEGISLVHKEFNTIKYDGPKIQFVISPKLLIEIVKRHHDCSVSEDKMKVKGGRFTYVASLGVKDEEESENG